MNHGYLEINHRHLEVNHRYLEMNHKHLEVNHGDLEMNYKHLEVNHGYLEINHRYLEMNHRCLEANHGYLEINHRYLNESQALRSDHHRVYTKEVNKIALNSNNDKRIQTFDKFTAFPYETNIFKACESEMQSKNKLIELDEDIDITKTEDIDISKTEDKDKTKTGDKDILDKINNKINTINKMNEKLEKVKAEITKKIELICESMCELQDEIYSDDSWLRQVELEKIDAVLDEALNVVWNMIRGENRIRPEEIKIDKHKDIDGYISKLKDVINNKIELVNKMGGVIDHVMNEIKNETNMIDKKIQKVSEMDNDTQHLFNDKLRKIMKQSRKNIEKIVV